MTDIFEDLVAERSEATEATEQAEATAEATETNGSEWPKTVTLPAGERPEGSVLVAEFADLINKQIVRDRVGELLAQGADPIDAATQAATSQLNPASFYQAVKAQRNQMPHYVVRYEVEVTDAEGNATGEVKTEEKVFVPVDVATEWWKNRPTRGGGGVSRSEEDVEKRLVRAGKKAANLAQAEARYAKLGENINGMREQLEKYTEWLKEDGKTLDDAKAAYEKSLEAEEEANAISDNE